MFDFRKLRYKSVNLPLRIFGAGGYRCILIAAFLISISVIGIKAQNFTPVSTSDTSSVSPPRSEADSVVRSVIVNRTFRVETLNVSGGAELITIFAKAGFDDRSSTDGEVPLISILRDTLGDDLAENDRLRYLWVLTYANPSLTQKITAAIPFLYQRTTNKTKAGNGPPRPIADIQPLNRSLWNEIFMAALKKFILDDFAIAVKAPISQYRRNTKDYKRASVAQALALLAVFQATGNEQVLSDSEMKDIQARLMLSDNYLGSLMLPENLERLHEARTEKSEITRSQNWDLLRQFADAQDLYFQPLKMPDGTATHALVWVAEEDLVVNRNRKFNERFLNIKSPWNDPRLARWEGYSEIRWFDEENRIVEPDSPNAHSRKLIPLALYGLDFPKIPILLVDFRNTSNPHRREMSRRILDDVTRNIVGGSVFTNPAVYLGRHIFDFVVRRKGIDINQASRLNSYAQLKLLVLLNESLDPEFGKEIAKRVEAVSLNPLQNDLQVEMVLARQQYQNLISYAQDPEGLPAKIERERGKELIRYKHNKAERFLLNIARVFSFGLYKHSEKVTPELIAKVDIDRQFAFHNRNLVEIARRSVRPEIDSDMNSLRNSLEFFAEYGDKAGGRTAVAISQIFSKSGDSEIRTLSIQSLYRINNPTAIKELLAMYNDENTEPVWRDLCGEYLRLAVAENPGFSSVAFREISDLHVD